MTNNLALVFPGQGSQYVGMGKALSGDFAAAKKTFAEADDALGFPLSQLCFAGPEEVLKLTENTQPAILASSVAAFRVLQAEAPLRPTLVAGHSLGEYSALVAAGARRRSWSGSSNVICGRWWPPARLSFATL